MRGFSEGFEVHYNDSFTSGFMPVQVLDPNTMLYTCVFVDSNTKHNLDAIVEELANKLKRKILNSKPALHYC